MDRTVLITPTGERPEAFVRCVEYMKAQDCLGPVKWVIVDDGRKRLHTPSDMGDWEVIHLRPQPFWESGQNTQARNIVVGLEEVEEFDNVLIIEDDDYYAPWWIRKCRSWLNNHELVGEAPSLYRHLNGAEKRMNNKNHASLCSTGLRGGAIDTLRRTLIRTPKVIDVNLWRNHGTRNKKIYSYRGGVIGIKGYPGRPGIGVGHSLKTKL